MRTERHARLSVRLVVLLTAVLLCFGTSLSTAPVAMAKDDAKYHLDYGPDSGKQCPVDWSGGVTCGIDKQGHYCLYDEINDDSICRMPEVGELPGTIGECENAGGEKSPECSDGAWKAVQKKKLEKWRKDNIEAVRKGELKQADYDKWNGFLTKCIDDKGWSFSACKEAAYQKYGPIGGQTLGDWVGKKISDLARDALEEAAQYIGNAVVWLLQSFADIFNKTSVINLDSTGISQPMGIAMALSVVIAVFLLLLQFGKVAISHQGGPAATAISGLAKWVVILSAYWTVTTTALEFSDQLSDWIVNYGFHGASTADHGSASDALKAKFGEMFAGLIGSGSAATAGGALITGAGLDASAVAVVIVIGIVCILAIGALWVEMLLRQAGIMILVATMPITLVGQMSDATKDWWPKARDALLTLILMKPMITFCFAIGFFAIEQGEGVQNMIVGLVIFLMACFCWPAIAKFMTFSTLGAGAAMASGLMSSVGSSASSMSGAGMVGGGSGYTRALERDNAQSGMGSGAKKDFTNTAGGELQGSFGKGAGRGRLSTRVAGPLGLGLQVMAAGKGVLESGMANTAAHAGLDTASPGGGHVVIAPRRPDRAAPAPAEQTSGPSASGAPREG
ncbi:hypothetical protein ACH4ZX_36585 [Streptomyces sp. NPDC020490]|uniref:hypothetical protein n=1 Tax=Streptomyces sp. NPDC020490 TaxID=3365078 RepID=UPI0037A309E4